MRTVNLRQPWRKIEERVKEIVKEGRKDEDEGAGEDGGPSDGIAWNGGERGTRLRLEEKAGAASASREDEEGTLLLTILLGLLWKEMKL